MIAAVLIAAASLSVQPTKTTPLDMLKICSFNDALADESFMHHWVEVTSPITTIERDSDETPTRQETRQRMTGTERMG